ncbi:MAG TPA: rhodanese-like domain-containing protein [Actinomycetota bacterium]|nr:rhodanese-like domain-containing protein [Actinomycetota bacterium]
MDAVTAAGKLEEMLVIDVREAYEVEEGHLPGAVHIPIGQLGFRLFDLDNSRPVLVVCETGQRSGTGQELLTAHGFDAHNLDGGMWGWRLRKLPVVIPEPGD